MQPTNDKRYYSPQFSQLAAVSVRRLAWALNKPMPATVDFMVKLMPSFLTPSKICQSCKDKAACQVCIFSKPLNTEELTALVEAVF